MNKKDMITTIALAVLTLGLIVLLIVVCVKTLGTPDKLEANNDIPPIDVFDPSEYKINSPSPEPSAEPESSPSSESETVNAEPETTPSTLPEEPVVTEDPALTPNDDMIYAAMESKTYKDICKRLGVKLRVGITNIENTDAGIVTTFILDNTDAMFTSTKLNNATTYSDIANKYGDEYAIIYFPDGVPDYSKDIYGYLGSYYAGHCMVADFTTEVEYSLLDKDDDKTVHGYFN